jgi:hypothetical protein
MAWMRDFSPWQDLVLRRQAHHSAICRSRATYNQLTFAIDLRN